MAVLVTIHNGLEVDQKHYPLRRSSDKELEDSQGSQALPGRRQHQNPAGCGAARRSLWLESPAPSAERNYDSRTISESKS
ncbi:Guanylate Cyclase Soluble Subunit Beta-2 [Manis pentadactyla]|nr:Guanylate Cyclase Soluble Subunit Beta-2 [Manis pentadactyla]